MTKFRLILPFCFVTASGCALCDCEKRLAETATKAAVPVVGSEFSPPATVVEVARPEEVAPPVLRPRALAGDDVRRLQKGLREIGLNPGPVDGIPGAQTKAAYVRLQSSCSRLSPLLENLHTAEGRLTRRTAAGDTIPNRTEVQEIQRQVRDAGFAPGPVDGIFGSRTQSVLRKLQHGCVMAKEFEGMLDQTSPIVVTDHAGTPTPETSMSSSTSKTRGGVTPAREDAEAAAVQPVEAREEVRILQLRLRDAGFDPGPFDGIMGPKTTAALAQYKTSQGGKKVKTSLKNQSVGDYY